MPTEIFIPWRGEARRDAWIALFGNMTGVPQTRIRTLNNAVHSAASDGGRSYGWNVWCSQCEVPYCEEEQTPHEGRELLLASETAARSCDAAIFRIVDQGSTMLGDLYEIALKAAHAPPILVLLPVDELISKPFPAIEDEHPQVTFKRWDELLQIYQFVSEWLESNNLAISTGPTRRSEIESDYEPLGRALRLAWKGADGRKRQAVMTALMLTRTATLSLFDDPAQLSTCGDLRLRLACGTLSVDPDAIRIMAAAQQVLDNEERDTWYVWSRNRNPDYALGVLQSAVLERPIGTINRTGRRLNHPGAWDQQGRSFETGGAI
jgi:hypothetical protein